MRKLVADGADRSQETLGMLDLIASLLDKDVEYDSMLIDGAPEPVALAADLERQLVHMPLVAGACTPTTESRGVAWAELRAPRPDRLVAHDDAAQSKEDDVLTLRASASTSTASPRRGRSISLSTLTRHSNSYRARATCVAWMVFRSTCAVQH